MMMLWEPGLWGNFIVAQHHTKQFFFPLLSIVGVLVWILRVLWARSFQFKAFYF